MQKLLEKTRILTEALPYIRAFYGKTLVIKFGGKAMVDKRLTETFAEDVVLMKYVGMNPVVIHGGGPQIDAMMRRLGKEPTFVKGIRVTDKETMEIVEMVLGGVINAEIVEAINRHGGRAVGLTGKDGRMITARKITMSSSQDSEQMGMAGEVEAVDPQVLKTLEEDRFIPVIAPLGSGRDGATYNVNADLVAGSIAAALKAEKLIILTDIKGVMEGRRLLSTLSAKEIQGLVKKGLITSGMLPKVHACETAITGGVVKAHIIDGRVPHALLLEIFTDKGIGTEIVS